MAMHLAIGVRTDGTREVLDMWFAGNEGAAFGKSEKSPVLKAQTRGRTY